MRILRVVSVFLLLAMLLSAVPGAVMGQSHPPSPTRLGESTTDALQVCSSQVDPPEGKELPYLQTTVPLSEDGPLFEILRESKGARTFELVSADHLGSLEWDQATLATYRNTDVKALLVPIESGGPFDTRSLVGYYSEQSGLMRTVILEVSTVPVPAADYDARDGSATVPFSGVISYYTPDGRLLASATFEENQLISAPAGFWDCFGQCLDSCWKSLPFWLQIACGGSCGACMWGNVPACAVCAACLAGAAIPCTTCCAEYGHNPEWCRCD